ncbi:MAG: M15 family metallopeptidase [Clostridium perfringens]|nr:M15 family metallopeptidase [Clostridium perfringens]
MKKFFKTIIMSIIMILFTNTCVFAKNDYNNYDMVAKEDLLCLSLAYNDYIKDICRDDNGFIYLITRSNRKILYDDKKVKSDEEKLNSPDLQDMLEDTYSLNSIECVVEEGKNPGRVRVYPLLNEVYGYSEINVQNNLETIITPYGTVSFNGKNGAAKALKNALEKAKSCEKEQNSKIIQFVLPIMGTFNYRYIQGTGRLSPHSFGIAIDLNKSNSDYWKWAKKEDASKRIASYPKELVKAFEENGFVWGGKWAKFDILHFEYRPEIILKAKYFSEELDHTKPWYGEIPLDDKTSEIIKKIDELF